MNKYLPLFYILHASFILVNKLMLFKHGKLKQLFLYIPMCLYSCVYMKFIAKLQVLVFTLNWQFVLLFCLYVLLCLPNRFYPHLKLTNLCMNGAWNAEDSVVIAFSFFIFLLLLINCEMNITPFSFGALNVIFPSPFFAWMFLYFH